MLTRKQKSFLKKDSFLEYLPDPLIAYKDARYHQKNIVHMEQGATLIYSDILTPGWSPEGEHFSYDSLRLINEIYMENELVLFDHIKLNPKEQYMDGLGVMEGYTHLGSFIVISEISDSEILDRLYEEIQHENSDFKAGLSALIIPGFTIRIMANSTQLIERILKKCHHIISKEWYKTEPSFLRKY
ncbi:urease accessory protein UreD [Virgibacillus halodenitrificans]|uniref:urease accessory protein UreD n=1 Tax=Virgibacillus halodenitrificans TaxID=1482 RepID=UPI000ABEB0C7